MNLLFLEELLKAVSVSGYEEPVQEIVENEMKTYMDQCMTDEMNNLVCVLNQENPFKIMLSAHGDEIGLMVSNIMDNGRLQVVARGGVHVGTYLGQAVQLKTPEGIRYGVVEASKELLGKKGLKAGQMVIDIGAESKEEAKRLVELGTPVVPDSGFRQLTGGRITARALDDKIGVFIIMEAQKLARERGVKPGIYAASTVGEETTKSGAYWTSARICPDLAVIVDVTDTSDCTGSNATDMGTVKLGGGPVLCNGPTVSKRLNKKMEECAKRAGIYLQWEAAERLSHTDADQIHFSNRGVPVVLVSVPLRNMHMPNEVADMLDVEGCILLLAEFLCSFE